MDPAMYVKIGSPLRPFGLKPNYQGYCAGEEVTIDGDGNRAITPSFDELRPGRAPDGIILLLGDSGIFGFGLKDADTIGSRLQSRLLSGGLNLRVRNVGVSGYTSWNEYDALQEYFQKNKANDVILLFMPNDLTFENDYFGIGRGNVASLDRGSSRTVRYTRWLYSHFYTSFLLSDGLKRLVVGATRGKGEAKNDFREQEQLAEIDYAMEALGLMQKTCELNGAKLSVGIYRDISYFNDKVGWLRYEETIQSNLERKGIRWFVVKGHTDSLTPSEIQVAWNDVHPGPKAVELITQDIANAITAQ